MAAATRVYVPNARDAKYVTESYEGHRPRRDDDDEDESPLSLEERGVLMREWGGYDVGRSAGGGMFGAVLDASLRAPPRTRPVQRLVVEQLKEHGGRQTIEELIDDVVTTGKATRHEVRLAIDAMSEDGRVTLYVQEMPERKQDVYDTGSQGDGWIGRQLHVSFRTVHLPTVMVHLEPPEKRGIPPELTPAERWARADEALHAYCVGYVPCHETRGGRRPSDPDVVYDVPEVKPALTSRLFDRDRRMLESAYGTAVEAPYADVFGREVAALVEYTETFWRARARLPEGMPALEALHAIMLHEPGGDDEVARRRWRAERARFVMAVTQEANRLLGKACASLRVARRAR